MSMEKNVGNHRVWWDDEYHVARLKMIGTVNEEEARSTVEHIVQLFEDNGRHYLVVDMSESPEEMDRSARAVFQESDVRVDKNAVVGAKKATRIMAKVVMAITGQWDTTRYFETDDEAVEWLA